MYSLQQWVQFIEDEKNTCKDLKALNKLPESFVKQLFAKGTDDDDDDDDLGYLSCKCCRVGSSFKPPWKKLQGFNLEGGLLDSLDISCIKFGISTTCPETQKWTCSRIPKISFSKPLFFTSPLSQPSCFKTVEVAMVLCRAFSWKARGGHIAKGREILVSLTRCEHTTQSLLIGDNFSEDCFLSLLKVI